MPTLEAVARGVGLGALWTLQYGAVLPTVLACWLMLWVLTRGAFVVVLLCIPGPGWFMLARWLSRPAGQHRSRPSTFTRWLWQPWGTR